MSDVVILRTEGLTRRFGELTAVKDLSIEIKAGEVFGLLGPNGAGKTTVIKMLTTLLPPTSGRAWVAGFDVTRSSAYVRRAIGYVPQVISADGLLTGFENLSIFAKLYDVPRAERKARIEGALGFVGLSDAAGTLVKNFSGGMIRRLEIAQALLHRPKVLFLDEPTLALDPTARKTVWQHILALQQDFGTTILLTTHYMDEAESLCTRVAIMNQGEVVALGSPEELKRNTGNKSATLDDCFTYYTGGSIETGGSFRETRRSRQTGRRLG